MKITTRCAPTVCPVGNRPTKPCSCICTIPTIHVAIEMAMTMPHQETSTVGPAISNKTIKLIYQVTRSLCDIWSIGITLLRWFLWAPCPLEGHPPLARVGWSQWFRLVPLTKSDFLTYLCHQDYIGSTARLRFRKSIYGHQFQTIRKLANIYFQYHRGVIYSI